MVYQVSLFEVVQLGIYHFYISGACNVQHMVDQEGACGLSKGAQKKPIQDQLESEGACGLSKGAQKKSTQTSLGNFLLKQTWL